MAGEWIIDGKVPSSSGGSSSPPPTPSDPFQWETIADEDYTNLPAQNISVGPVNLLSLPWELAAPNGLGSDAQGNPTTSVDVVPGVGIKIFPKTPVGSWSIATGYTQPHMKSDLTTLLKNSLGNEKNALRLTALLTFGAIEVVTYEGVFAGIQRLPIANDTADQIAMHYGHWHSNATPHFSYFYGWEGNPIYLNIYANHKAVTKHTTSFANKTICVRFYIVGTDHWYEVSNSLNGPWEVIGYKAVENDWLYNYNVNQKQPFFVFSHIRYGSTQPGEYWTALQRLIIEKGYGPPWIL